jgi:hypothetical protein
MIKDLGLDPNWDRHDFSDPANVRRNVPMRFFMLANLSFANRLHHLLRRVRH